MEWGVVKDVGLGWLACLPKPQGLSKAAHTCSDMKQIVKALPSCASLMSSDSMRSQCHKGVSDKKAVLIRCERALPQVFSTVFHGLASVCVFLHAGAQMDPSDSLSVSARVCVKDCGHLHLMAAFVAVCLGLLI